MFRKILSVIFAIFMFLPNIAHSAEMVNVEYIHKYLNARWGIDLPRNPLTNPYAAANMKYLLTVVDIANEYLNGEKTTSYGTGAYATLAAADTVATKKAIDTLISVPTFTITTTPDTSDFSMIIGAAGNFTIDWGDGQSDVITDKPIGTTTYTHAYSSSGAYKIKLTGLATDYSDAATDAAVSFYTSTQNVYNISKISGSLGKIFPTLPDGSQPRFYETFYNSNYYASRLREIPADLFAGIHGAPAEYMFYRTFQGAAITEIPDGLFAGIQGAPAANMFSYTFSGTAITEIPADLFAGIQGAPATRMFASTFSNTDITEIPADLFAGIQGAPAVGMFEGIFAMAPITEIPADLFAGIQGAPAANMFYNTFSNTVITEIPDGLFAGIRGTPASSMFNATFRGCSRLQSIPEILFAGISGDPASSMFYNTFQGCTQLQSIPENLFAGIQGAPAQDMFYGTFYRCYKLQSIPENLFAGISGPAAGWMFYLTFGGCTSLTGPSARINGQYLYEIWPNVSTEWRTYEDATGLSDYDQIPSNWK